MDLKELACPNCGASVHIAPGAATATCEYCGTNLMISHPQNDTGAQAGYPGIDMRRIQQHLGRDDKIGAIKVLRDQTDLSLKDAKDFIDALARGDNPVIVQDSGGASDTPEINSSGLDWNHIRSLVAAGKSIEAIKYHREITGMGLKESKDAIDTLRRQMGSEPAPPARASRFNTQNQPANRQKTSSGGCRQILGAIAVWLLLFVAAGISLLFIAIEI